MPNYKTDSRLKELSPKYQKTLISFVNHLASLTPEYRSSVFERLEEMSHENPWTDDIPGLDKEKFLKKYPIEEE